MKVGRYVVLAAALAGVAAYGWRHWRHDRVAEAVAAGTLPQYDDAALNTRVPDGITVTVEVLNATTKSGLGRRATMYLRDRGFDVVYTGTTPKGARVAHTVVYDRSRSPQKAALVAKAMRGRVESRPDTSRYLDATVLVGDDWAPPLLPLYP